jgi:HD-GYP domain-containing protein (c-di-GMP phosphodiesterase class II)
MDGSGYPDGLAGDAIPLGARIVAVADVYDALTVDRPYRKALAPDAALAMLGAEAGRGLDGDIVAVFDDLVRQGSV